MDTEVHWMNDAGAIVGSYRANNINHAFLRSPDGTLTTIDPPGATFANATGINSRGTIIGISSLGSYIRKKGGSYTFVQGIDYPWGINAAGEVAGMDVSHLHGFLRATDGTLAEFDLPSGASMQAGCLDTEGDVVGWYSDGDRNHGFLRKRDGTMTTIDVPGSYDTTISSIDAHGTAIGTTWTPKGWKGFLYEQDGSFRILHLPFLAKFSGAARLSNRGHILGGYTDMQGKDHAYLRTR